MKKNMLRYMKINILILTVIFALVIVVAPQLKAQETDLIACRGEDYCPNYKEWHEYSCWSLKCIGYPNSFNFWMFCSRCELPEYI